MRPRSRQICLLSTALAIALVACSNQEPAQTEPSEADPAVSDTADAPVQPAPRLEIPFEHVVLSQTGVFTGDDDATGSSTLTVEFLTGTPEEMAESLTGSLRTQRFTLSNTESVRGGQRHTFRRANGERLSILIRPQGEVELVTKGALGSIYASWRR